MMRSNPSRRYAKNRMSRTRHVTVGTNHSSTLKTSGSVAGIIARNTVTTEPPDSIFSAKLIKVASPDSPEKPDLHISPESTDEEKGSAWNQIKTLSPNLSQFLNLLMTELGRPRNVSVRWSSQHGKNHIHKDHHRM